MGEEDHLFLPAIRKVVTDHIYATLMVVKNCGHVVNIEQATIFNSESILFIEKQL